MWKKRKAQEAVKSEVNLKEISLNASFDFYETAMRAASVSVIKTSDKDYIYNGFGLTPEERTCLDRSLAELAKISSDGEYSVIVHSKDEMRALGTGMDIQTALVMGISKGTGYVLSELEKEIAVFNFLYKEHKIPMPMDWSEEEREAAALDPIRAMAKIAKQFRDGGTLARTNFYTYHSHYFDKIIAAAEESEKSVTIDELAEFKKELEQKIDSEQQKTGKKFGKLGKAFGFGRDDKFIE